MANPSNLNGVIVLNGTNESIAGTFVVSGFLVNPTALNWHVQIDDENSRLFSASSSGASFEPFGHTLHTPLSIRNITGTTLTNIKEVLVYLI